jgi:hypothetical protein
MERAPSDPLTRLPLLSVFFASKEIVNQHATRLHYLLINRHEILKE